MTLAARGAFEEHRCWRRHPNIGRSGLHNVRGGGQPAQDVVRLSDMDNERNFLAPIGQQFSHVHPFRGDCLSYQLYQKGRGMAVENTKFRDRKENEAEIEIEFVYNKHRKVGCCLRAYTILPYRSQE
jgi:hypothetical protein